MLSLYDTATIEAALHQPLEPALRTLIVDRLAFAAAAGLQDHTTILVVNPGDNEAAIETEIGFSPLVNPLSGGRFGTDDFRPYWAWLADLGGWYELCQVIEGSSYAYLLLIEKADGVLPELLRLCEAYANPDGSGGPCV